MPRGSRSRSPRRRRRRRGSGSASAGPARGERGTEGGGGPASPPRARRRRRDSSGSRPRRRRRGRSDEGSCSPRGAGAFDGAWDVQHDDGSLEERVWLIAHPLITYLPAGGDHRVTQVQWGKRQVSFIVYTERSRLDVTLKRRSAEAPVGTCSELTFATADRVTRSFALAPAAQQPQQQQQRAPPGSCRPTPPQHSGAPSLMQEMQLAIQCGDAERADRLRQIARHKAQQEREMEAVEKTQVIRRIAPEAAAGAAPPAAPIAEPAAGADDSRSERRKRRQAKRKLMQVFGGGESESEDPPAAPPAPAHAAPPPQPALPARPRGPPGESEHEALVKEAKWWQGASPELRASWVQWCQERGGQLDPAKYTKAQLREAVNFLRTAEERRCPLAVAPQSGRRAPSRSPDSPRPPAAPLPAPPAAVLPASAVSPPPGRPAAAAGPPNGTVKSPETIKRQLAALLASKPAAAVRRTGFTEAPAPAGGAMPPPPPRKALGGADPMPPPPLRRNRFSEAP
eukprot:TRINITY_DN9348_c2_g1_i1.p1 TRINITY_DN9348_c2_g1~~TRINITY_DN9348_c2_g1_i1.p1  ORF type:complete len:512 (+),score=134.05 TRINITY_DN9348_c2_g1_i1:98-1633(+)